MLSHEFNDLFVYARTDADPKRTCELEMQLRVHTNKSLNKCDNAIII